MPRLSTRRFFAVVDTSRYAAVVGDSHRRRHGQFFTPPGVARFMVDWVLAGGARSLHDPAFGLGAFHEAALRHACVSFSGSELDSTILNYYRARTRRGPSTLRNEDYLLAWEKKHDSIVCNPPYLRFQHFRNRKAVFSAFRRHTGAHLSGYTNCASAFLLKSLRELNPGGRLAYVMPLEFLNTGYGTQVKARLLAGPSSLIFIQLDCERDVFPDAVTSVGIVLFDSATSDERVRFYRVRSLEELECIFETPPVTSVSRRDLAADQKWLPYLRPSRISVNGELVGSIRQYGRFTRGIATGANEFFVLRPSKVQRLGLDRAEATPCITKSKQISSAVLTRDDVRELTREDQPVVLFRPGLDLSKGAMAYVSQGERKQLHRRFLLRHRSPWYKGESRHPAPLLFGVFSRGGYKVVLNRTPALTLTCFHGFVPSLPGRAYVERLFLYLASSTGRELLAASSRRYGDALVKYEPDDLNGAIAPRPEVLAELGDEDVTNAVASLRCGHGVPSRIEDHFRMLAT